VLGEESDSFGDGFLSHFEIYMQAMREAGADPFTIRAFLAELKNGVSIDEALLLAQPPAEALEFVRTTFRFLNADKPHVTAAAFTFGREDLIPDMFRGMVKELGRSTEGVGLFEYYLDRHVEVDGDSHGPMALQMLNELCGEDEKKWDEAIAAAQEAIAARVAFWDGILLRIQSSEF
jgi:hypothetical protein